LKYDKGSALTHQEKGGKKNRCLGLRSVDAKNRPGSLFLLRGRGGGKKKKSPILSHTVKEKEKKKEEKSVMDVLNFIGISNS